MQLLGSKAGFAVDPSSPAAAWVLNNPGSPAAATIKQRIARVPAAHRVAVPEKEVADDIRPYLDAAVGSRAQALLFADADRGAGCPASSGSYRSWSSALAAAVGEQDVIIVLRVSASEPGGRECSTDPRPQVTENVVASLHASTRHARVILDVSDLAAQSVPAVQQFLDSLPLTGLTGIAVNVGGTAPDAQIADTVSKLRRGDLLVVQDSSRSGGDGPPGCNSPQARLGPQLSLSPDAGWVQKIWITTPGVSDGPCGAAPGSKAGEFVPELAVALTR
ncbi:hypothetical protein DMA12_40220 [Amycolatopsis balhimycina DSM 5908]|uniref:Glucanase n=1 Tax=Amycolatopsis balhimycina DSM 5908 TaxID=1081091 RepID=A0A428W084_AMYBA|nr:hypothetical protein [Amycolatopsis balhimycina]RSM36457.1 hypothetical protein DMA12_40220 [Amycolatopsis balhimycina DSM 5908]